MLPDDIQQMASNVRRYMLTIFSPPEKIKKKVFFFPRATWLIDLAIVSMYLRTWHYNLEVWDRRKSSGVGIVLRKG